MKICCLGDIHYNGSRDWLVDIVNNYVKDYCNGCDVTVIVGDITNYGDLTHVKEVLEIIKETVEPAPVLVVPGNHDIYVTLEEEKKGVDSLVKLELFNDLVEEIGIIALMKRPFILDGIGFVGNIGWYDYSFIPEYLDLTLEDYKNKAIGLQVWADKDYIKLPFSDEEFTKYLLNRFEEQVKKIYNSVDAIVVALHHLPFRKLIKHEREPSKDYFATFMGSESFGYIIKKHSNKIKLVVYGHSHGNIVTRICRYVNTIKCCNCASPIPLVLQI